MDVLDRLQSGLFFRPNVADITPTIIQPYILPNQAQPTIHYQKNASSSIPAATLASINSSTPEVPLPLLSVSANVDVHGRLCTTKVTQQFSNASSSTTQNARYVFPIYDGSVVTSFRCWIGNDRLLEGAVKAKEAARADFKHAVSQRKVAVLVEELVPEVFETSVGNIPAQTTVKIEITYTNLLKVDNSTGGLVLTIPTSIAPRYGDVPEGYSGNESLLTEGLRINVQASMPTAIRKMESRSHPISVEMGAVSHKSFTDFAASASSDMLDYSKGRATLSDRKAVLGHDFVLHILCSSREFSRSRAIAASQPGQPSLSTIAVTVHPGDLFCQNVNMEDFVGEIIFMADRSGSMKSKIPSLINVMNIFLRSLPEACSFNIASFGSQVTWLWPFSMRYSQTNLDVAAKHVDSFKANYGGTEIYGALHSVLDHYNERNDVPTNVILLTDGEVWDVDNVIQLVHRTASNGNSNIRFFSLGIGDQVSHRLVEGIGQQGGGYAEVVPESSMGSWQERVIQMLKAALTPSRLQCNVDLGKELAMKTSERQIAGYTVQYPEWVQAPHQIPVLSTFSHFSLYYILESGLDSLPKTINITTTTERGEKLSAQLPIQTVAEQPAIHHLAAKALMNDYETGQSWLHSLNPVLKSTNSAGFEKVLEQEAQHVGQTWSIPSKWTSYVAIDRTTAQQHAISVHKADSIEFSQLTRPRHTSTSTEPRIGKRKGPFVRRSLLNDPRNSSFGIEEAGTQFLSVPAPPPGRPYSLDTSFECTYTASPSTFGAGVGVPAFDYHNQPTQTQYHYHDASRASPAPQVTSQPAELEPRSRDASVTSSLLTQSRGRVKAAATCNDPDEDKDIELHYAYPVSDVDSDEAIAVAPHAHSQRPEPILRRAKRYVKPRRSSPDVNEAEDHNPPSPTDPLNNTTWMGIRQARFCRPRSPDREPGDPDHPRPSDFPPLDRILRMQQADGKFLVVSSSFRSALNQKYEHKALRQFLTSRFGRKSLAMGLRLCQLAYNVCLVVYITHEYASSKALWELQVAKARQWIKRIIIEWLKESGDSEEIPETSLEESAESMLEEMDKLVLQQS
ncbi:VIT and vWA domain-containing protein [Aspergillus fischeri NRRL 181]|uniref:von Willebrand factor type A domain protein n=1 Tax=Neosartorya fischeri (strain ATCC 1020 / DSM 3700 / CBS 544.65 / FGSC A1164 / JCM 1740 / NRRL 181 / WB 181) TaxID=331117 RepID=A1CV20_NEOFI|nr:von Willebrand factor type A domain protein [Aspergillus fischeri NRRL 181]EAW25597.1 von Willebrand factor type A domain protein [Aspergillus fischeri NRRL 181]